MALLLLVLLGGCAAQPDRYLTQEQDAQMRENCEQDGCVVIPDSVFQEMVQRMQQMGVLSRGGMIGHR